MDRNRDGVVTIDEFIETCQRVIQSSNWTYTWCIFVHKQHNVSCICFLLSTGWEYNGFHAALWERHLVSVEGRGPGMLHSASGPQITSPILKRKEKTVLCNTFDILIQIGGHYCFSCRNVLCREMWRIHQITGRRNVSLHEDFIFAHDQTSWAWVLAHHLKACDAKHIEHKHGFYRWPLWNLGKREYFVTVLYGNDNNPVSKFFRLRCQHDALPLSCGLNTCWNKYIPSHMLITLLTIFSFSTTVTNSPPS